MKLEHNISKWQDENGNDFIPCCKILNLEVEQSFEEWLNANFIKYDNEYYQDQNRNGIWKKHQLYELYEDITKSIINANGLAMN